MLTNYNITINKNINKKINYFVPLSILFIILLIAISPQKYITACLNGILVWGKSVLPALFPFFFLTKLLSEYDLIFSLSQNFKFLTKFLFKSPPISAFVFLSSIISGYPVGAKLISELYENGQITENQANKMITFCSTSGPLFIVGTVGIGMFASAKLGYILFFSHIISSILNGILYRNFFNKEQTVNNLQTKVNTVKKDNILYNSMYNSIISILLVGGYIAFFFIIIEMINSIGVINFLPNIFKSFFNGIIEVTRGCLDLSKLNLNFTTLAILAGSLISFGGMSVHLQSLTFLNKCKIKKWFYFLQKITHAIFTAGVIFIICLIF